MREQDVRRTLKDVCDLLDRRAKAAPIAMGVALAMGAACGGDVVIKADAPSAESSTSTTANSDSGVDSMPILDVAFIIYGIDTTGVASDSTASDASDADGDVDYQVVVPYGVL
jgi:ABC-type tungstate transport system permease subunit